MKSMVAALTLIAAVATPVMASAATVYHRTNPAHPYTMYRGNPLGAHDEYYGSPYGAYDQYYGRDYLGRDPDPRIDQELRRDPPDDR